MSRMNGKKNQNAPRPSERPPVRVRGPVRGGKMSGLQYSSESYGGKQKHVENDGHLNEHL